MLIKIIIIEVVLNLVNFQNLDSFPRQQVITCRYILQLILT